MLFDRCYGCMQKLSHPGTTCPHCGYDNTKDPAMQPSHTLPCGMLLHNKYIVGKTLGQGGFGVTYIGWDIALETTVCIKEYFPNGAAMRDSSRNTEVYWSSGGNAEVLRQGQESLLKEARKAVKLRNLPSVVTVWDVFEENNTAYLVMDYIEGMTLRKYLSENGKPMKEAECIELFRPVMIDLEKAHQSGIIHRDISPDNLMLRSDGKLILLDFGAAKDLNRGNGQTTTQTTTIRVAKKGFSPAEQYTENSAIGPWTDVYAMCATIAYCVTGKILPDALERVMGKSIDLSGFTPAFASVLEKGLAVRSEDRIRSMGELLEALNRALEPRPAPKLKPFQLIVCLMTALLIVAGVISEHVGWWEKITQANQHSAEENTPETTVFAIESPISTLELVQKPMSESTLGSTLEPFDVSENGILFTVYGDHVEVIGADKAISYATIPNEVSGEPVTRIGKHAFDNCTSLLEVTIPENMSTIEDYAFMNCDALTTVSIPKNVTSIWTGAFYNCSKLSDIIIPEGVTIIQDYTFYGCNTLKNITISNDVKSIGNGAFYNCKELEDITIPKSVKSIGDYAFWGCSSIRSIVLPEGVARIGQGAFGTCENLTSIMLPNSLTDIEDSLFLASDALTSIRVRAGSFSAEFFQDDPRTVIIPLEPTEYQKELSSSARKYYYGDGVEQDYSKALELYTKAAEDGSAYAMYEVARMYDMGQGVKTDHGKALEWYNKAANGGHISAMFEIGQRYWTGLMDVETDYGKAFEWFTRAAKAGDPNAMYYLGVMYRLGTGVEKDYSEALEWYTKSAETGGYAYAMHAIGEMYENGEGVKRDRIIAQEWYDKAKAAGYRS